MLLKDAKEVDSRILTMENDIKSDFVVGDFDIIRGLEIVREINTFLNPMIIDDNTMAEYNKKIKAFTDRMDENFVIIPSFVKRGITNGLIIVDLVRKSNIKEKVKVKGNK